MRVSKGAQRRANRAYIDTNVRLKTHSTVVTEPFLMSFLGIPQKVIQLPKLMKDGKTMVQKRIEYTTKTMVLDPDCPRAQYRHGRAA